MAERQVRFDDRIETVVRRAGGSAALRAVGWQQLVDLLSHGDPDSPDQADQVYDLLDRWIGDASAERRARTAAAVADRALPPRLFAHLAGDDPAIAAPVLARADVDDAQLLELLPRLSPPARSLLRERESLSEAVARALEAYGPADRLVTSDGESENTRSDLPAKVPPEELDGSDRTTPIRTLVDRIALFRTRRPERPQAIAEGPDEPLPVAESVPADGAVSRFAFETGRDGTVSWTDAPRRGAIIGLTLAERALDGGGGVDAATADRVERRLSLYGAALDLPVGGPLAGAWRIDATPTFNPIDGRFLGYTGHAKRGIAEGVGARWALSRSDDLRQIIHELKTPLNAIVGFSELIAEQLLGPVPDAVRQDAMRMRQQGCAVLQAIEDVDQAARLDAGDLDRGSSADLPAVVAQVLDDWPTVQGRPSDARLVAVRPTTLRRMVGRLINGLVAAAGNERLTATISGRRRPRLRITTPAALAALPKAELAALRVPPVDGGPLLGLEFTLLMVRRWAERLGGGLSADEREFTLSLPAVVKRERSSR